MSDKERGLTLPDLPRNATLTPHELADIFYRVAEVLEREARVAFWGFSFTAGGLMLTGSINVRATAAILQTDCDEEVQPIWFESTLEILSDLGAKLSWKRSHFRSYSNALKRLVARRVKSEPKAVESPDDPNAEANGGRAEQCTKSGAVLLSRNHIAILNGLFDRPVGLATSSNDLIRATLPYLSRMNSSPTNHYRIRDALKTLHPSWVRRDKNRRFVEWRLTERGRDILELRIPAHVRGVGPYRGFSSASFTGSDE